MSTATREIENKIARNDSETLRLQRRKVEVTSYGMAAVIVDSVLRERVRQRAIEARYDFYAAEREEV